ncbi:MULTISPECIES: spore protease YyaC [Paenibacillus]|uniref:Spore protease YyaC n=1 Tax=Paenibacillus campinasensis TaxID=66347 RepID=A0A268EMV2_9BACL|nr:MULTISPECIES: spore protease YyaC [Paenibacillus]PAD74451.1 spore protease YyaC [Paenibacillus campinasensis]PAK50849.1 spore protease YyaC [Paenibacillus sp. 7541]
MSQSVEAVRGEAAVKMSGARLQQFFMEISSRYKPDQVTFVCIGTDRSTGDALGPLTGSKLLECGFPHVIGTMPEPCDARNLETRLKAVPQGQVLIAIDACLGHPSSVGHYLVSNGALRPGQSVGEKLPAVGDYSLAAVVNVHGPKPYWTLQVTSLHQVMTMAAEIARSAAAAFGLASEH